MEKEDRKAAQLSLVLGRAEGIKLKNHRGRGRLALSSQITRLSGRDYSPLILESARNEPFSLSPSIKKTGTGLRPSDATSWRGRSRMTPSSGFHGRKEGRRKVRFLSQVPQDKNSIVSPLPSPPFLSSTFEFSNSKGWEERFFRSKFGRHLAISNLHLVPSMGGKGGRISRSSSRISRLGNEGIRIRGARSKRCLMERESFALSGNLVTRRWSVTDRARDERYK